MMWDFGQPFDHDLTSYNYTVHTRTTPPRQPGFCNKDIDLNGSLERLPIACLIMRYSMYADERKEVMKKSILDVLDLPFQDAGGLSRVRRPRPRPCIYQRRLKSATTWPAPSEIASLSLSMHYIHPKLIVPFCRLYHTLLTLCTVHTRQEHKLEETSRGSLKASSCARTIV